MIYQRGDIVRLPNRRNYDVYRLDDGKYDAFKIEELSDGMVHLDHISTLIPLSEILPLPINEKADKHIYLDIPIAATTIREEDEAPIRTNSRTYYWKSILKIYGSEEIVKQHFQYVHEVQHWLREKHGVDLRINDQALYRLYLKNTHQQESPEIYMDMAIDLMKQCKQEGRNDGKISPSVAAVLVRPNGEKITAYRSELREGDHAEFTLIERKCRDKKLDGSVLYATLEPCAPGARHYPKLSCSERIVNARIKKVYVGIEDPDPSVARKGIAYLQRHGVEVEMFPKHLQEVIEVENAKFLEQAEERARRVSKGGEKVTLSSIENIVSTATFDSLDESLLAEYIKRLGINDDIRSGFVIQTFLQAGILAMNANNEAQPTGIGLLLFGKNPQLIYPNAKICATLLNNGVDEKIKDITGPLLNQPRQVEEWFELVIGSRIDRSHAERETIYNYPLNVIRELVINAILHRDYDMQGAAIQLRVSEDAITIMSPGQPVSPIRMEQLYDFTAPTLSRNPQIISIFNLFDLEEQRGLGFRTVRALPTTYKIPLPQVTYNDPYIVVTLPKNYDVSMTDSVLSEREKRALDYVRLKRAVTRKEYQEYMNLQERTAGRDLLRLVQLGYLDTVGDGKNLKYVVTEVVSRQIK